MTPLKRYSGAGEQWDRVCGRCKQSLPGLEYDQHDEPERPLFG
ncbi:MAG TPA: hypothetical protein VFA10_30005 [Ktedonobacteraceae bacterium]|nr:hypothetical protein [Ktedonobacteraceae bacterium]